MYATALRRYIANHSKKRNKYRKTIEPKDLDYGKRWAVERLFSVLKEMFGLAKNRFVGIKKVTIHVFSCLLANLLEYVM
ncbi:MAG: transposase [Candidatus Micrarchaeia archaeon]